MDENTHHVEDSDSKATDDVVDGVSQISSAQKVFKIDDHGSKVDIHLERSQLWRKSKVRA